MNHIIKLLIAFFILQVLQSCQTGYVITEDGKQRVNIHGFRKPCEEYSKPLDLIRFNHTLKIINQCTDCGEWGGHKETIYLTQSEENKIFARFILDTVNCFKIIEKNGIGVLDDNYRVIVLDTCKVLTTKDEELLSTFLQRLVELYLKNEMHSNAGFNFVISSSDSNFYLSFWNSGNCRDTYYPKVRRQIFGDILKQK